MVDAPSTPPGAARAGLAGRLLVAAVVLYQQLISPLIPASCRYYPTCSQYAREAIRSHGVLPGLGLALRRILSCHPFSRGGYDPVPAPHCKATGPRSPTIQK